MRAARACLLTALAVAPARGGENPGTTAAQILQQPLGARAVSMAGAFTAVADDSSALYYNPAGVSLIDSREVGFMYHKGIEGQSLEFISATTPLPFSGIVGEGYSALGAGLLLAQYGTIEVNRTAADGSLLSTENLSAGGDMVATLSYAERAARFEVSARKQEYVIDHFIGVSGKFIRSTLAERYSASSYAADLGYLGRVQDAGVSVGLAILNVGSRMRFIDHGDPLPMSFRGGVSFRPLLAELAVLPQEQSLLFSADGEYFLYERQWHVSLGMEYVLMRSYALRLGYQLHRDLAGMTVGFGGAWRNFRVDYGWAFNEDFSDTHRFSVTYRFGKVPAYKREFKRRPFIESMPEREDLQGLEEEVPRDLAPPRRPRRTVPQDRLPPGWIY